MNQVTKELKRFLVAGVCAVTIDLIAYYLLLDFLSHDIAKAISFVLGTIFAFLINKYWTFEKHKKSYKEVFQFGVLYIVTLGFNVLTNKMVIDNTQMVFLAFLMATGVSTVLNFIGQKWWVFR
jgi:putative flippase GtrA